MIEFHAFSLNFHLPDSRAVSQWLAAVCQQYGQTVEELNIIFCTDDELLELNRQHLQHDFYTDILTFDNRNAPTDPVFGDLYISVDRVAENAQELNVTFDEEMRRVMVHGALHLLGFSDETDEQEAEMRGREDAALALYKG